MQKPELRVEALEGGKKRVSVSLPFDVIDADSALAPDMREQRVILESSVTPARRKIAAARWLLQQLQSCTANEGAALFFLETLVITLRSATFALQKSCSGIDGFDHWYTAQQDSMRADSLLRWIVDLRNAAEKQGLLMGVYGPRAVMRLHLDDSNSAEYGPPSFGIAGFESDDLLLDLAGAVDKLSAVVEEAHHLFLPQGVAKQMTIETQYLRETLDGQWEPYDPGPQSSEQRVSRG